MRRVPLTWSAAILAAACAGGSAGPLFEYGPTDTPLRYQISGSTESAIETPMGAQNQGGTVEATVTVDIGGAMDGGRAVTVVYEALETSGAGVGRLGGGDLIGQRFVGVLASDGEMSFTGVPTAPATLARYFDATSFLTQMLMPLPPEGGTDLESWPVHLESTESTQMTMFSTADGTARVVGDTVWNGISAKIVVVEADYQIEGSGTPEGSPAELELVASGPVTSRYVWDATRGVMLASSTEGGGEGTVSIPSMSMSMPITMTSKQTTELQR